MARWYRRDPLGTLFLSIHAQPGASRTETAGLHGDALKVRIAAPALDGRANEELVEFLARRLGVARRDVAVVSGEKSRRKRVSVRGASVVPELLLEG
jgi:uncharacterized protein (TIGR00251 family)